MTSPKLRLAWLLAAIALPGLSGCEMEPDPKVVAAEKRGADWAWEQDVKKVTDCGALEDLDERQGCAKWVNNRDDQ
jgi:hypothetical protein